MLATIYLAFFKIFNKKQQIALDSEVIEWLVAVLLVAGFFRMLTSKPSKGKAQDNLIYVGAIAVGLVLFYHATN